MRVLYVSYDGMTDPLGRSQVLPYLSGLAELGHEFHLISFEKNYSPDLQLPDLPSGVQWTGLKYHRRPTLPATAWDMARGGIMASIRAMGGRVELVHARSYVAAGFALPVCRILKIPLLFDMRGLWVDERIESGAWGADTQITNAARQMERTLLTHATVATVLTNSMAAYLQEQAGVTKPAPIRVIPTCADLEHFHPEASPNPAILGELAGRRTLLYLGALGGRFRMDALAHFYRAWRALSPSPTALLVVSGSDPQLLMRFLEPEHAREVVHVSVERDAVPKAIACAQAGVFAYTGAIAPKGVSPTKLGEMLGCGLPVAGNAVGDVAQIITDEVGAVFDPDDPASLWDAAKRLHALVDHPETKERCRQVAGRWYRLRDGVEAYAALYRDIASGNLVGKAGWPH